MLFLCVIQLVFFLAWLFVFTAFTADAVALLGVVAVLVSPAYRGYGLDVFAEGERLFCWSHGLTSSLD